MRQHTVVTHAFDFEEFPIDLVPKLAQVSQVVDGLSDVKVHRIIDRRFGAEGVLLFEVLLHVRRLVLDVEARLDPVGDDPGSIAEGGRRRVLVARSLHQEYREVLRTYAKNSGLQVEEIAYNAAGTLDEAVLKSALRQDVCAVVVQSPNFFGVIENPALLAETAHASGALLVVAVAEALSLGLLKPPAEADIVAMEGQSFGLAPSYGGPFVGVIASRDKFVRQMPGRLAGQTTDQDGRRGFVLTLATREQHIRREKATSNICTNQALCALAATVHLTLLGKEGIREMAEHNLSKAQFALSELEKIPGVKRSFTAPFFNEFAVELPRSVKMVNAELLKANIVGPYVLGSAYPELSKHALVCATETTTRAEMEKFAAAVKTALAQPL